MESIILVQLLMLKNDYYITIQVNKDQQKIEFPLNWFTMKNTIIKREPYNVKNKLNLTRGEKLLKN